MVIKIYISGNSGNKEIVTHQQRIFMILKSLGISFEPVDIAAPGMEDARDHMRAEGKKKEGQRNVLPPQIFNEDKYCGDYDAFDVANEDDELEEFLGIPRVTPKSQTIFGSNSKPTENGINDQEHSAQPTSETTNADEAAAAAAAESSPAAENGHEDGEGTTTTKADEPADAAQNPVEATDDAAAAPDEGGGGDEAAAAAPPEAAGDKEEEEAGEEEEYEYEDEEEGEE